VEGFAEEQKQVAVGFFRELQLPCRLIGGEFPLQGFQHDGAGLAQVLDGGDAVVATGAQQPDDVAHGADGFRGDALDALEFVRRAGAALGEIGEHLDAAEIAAHLVVQVSGDALADLEQFPVRVAAVA